MRPLHELADLSLAEYFRQLARYGGESAQEGGLLLFLGAHAQPNPYRNGAIRLAGDPPAAELAAQAQRFFVGRRSSYCLWVREHADADLSDLTAGCQELERLPEMVMRELPEALPLAPGVELRRAGDAGTRRDYLEVVANAWGMRSMPLEVAARVFFDPASLQEPNVAAFVAYYEDQPLSAAMTLVNHGVALGCQAATIRRPRPGQRLPPPGPASERRGLADACLVEALTLSFTQLGATLSLCQTSRRRRSRVAAPGLCALHELCPLPRAGQRGPAIRGRSAGRRLGLMARFGFATGGPEPVADLDEDARAFCAAVTALAQRDLGHGLAERDREGQFDRAAWEACAAVGLLGLPVPEEYGGSGASARHDRGRVRGPGLRVRRQRPDLLAGRPDVGRRASPGSLRHPAAARALPARPVRGQPDRRPRDERARVGLRRLCPEHPSHRRGRWLASERVKDVRHQRAGQRSVPRLRHPRSRPGVCRAVRLSARARCPGFEIGPPISKMGVRTSPMSELFLSDCLVGRRSSCSARPGGGMTVFTIAMRWERALILAGCVGAMHRQLQRCLAYARERTQFGADRQLPGRLAQARRHAGAPGDRAHDALPHGAPPR